MEEDNENIKKQNKYLRIYSIFLTPVSVFLLFLSYYQYASIQELQKINSSLENTFSKIWERESVAAKKAVGKNEMKKGLRERNIQIENVQQTKEVSLTPLDYSMLSKKIEKEKIVFFQNKEYVLCGRYTTVKLYSRVDGEIISTLPYCYEVEAGLFGTTALTGVLHNIEDNTDWIMFTTSSTGSLQDIESPGERNYYAKYDELSTPFTLTDGDYFMALEFGSLDKIDIYKNRVFTSHGGYDPCNGSVNPIFRIHEEDYLKSDNFDYVLNEFDLKKIILIKNVNIDINKSCGT